MNGQSRESGNIGCTRHKTKTSKTKNATQKSKMVSNKDPTKIVGEPCNCCLMPINIFKVYFKENEYVIVT